MQLCCVYDICLDEFYIGGSLQRVLRVLLFFLFVHGETHDNELRKRKRMEKEEREKKGGRGRKKRNIKRIVRKKRRGEVWAITTWLELQRTPSLLGIPLDPVTKGNDPRFLASKPDHHVFLRVYSISLSTIRGTVYDPTHCVLCITWKACQDWIPRYLWERKSRRVGMSMLIWKKFRQEIICKRFSN